MCSCGVTEASSRKPSSLALSSGDRLALPGGKTASYWSCRRSTCSTFGTSIPAVGGGGAVSQPDSTRASPRPNRRGPSERSVISASLEIEADGADEGRAASQGRRAGAGGPLLILAALD